MPGNIEGLTQLAQTFNTIGDRHVALGGDRQIQAGAGNWLGRAVNWIKSALNIGGAANVNSSIMSHVVGRIRDTEGMGDRFAEIARNRLGSALTRGTPITGREVSQVISDLVRVRGDEARAREANIAINVKALCAAPSAGEGSESLLVAAMREKMALFGMEGEMDALGPQDFQAVQDKVGAQFVRAGASPTPGQAREALLEACRQFSLARVKSHIDAKVQAHCGHSGPQDALPAALRARAGERGMTVDMSPEQMGKLEALVHKKLEVACTYNPGALHPPTDMETQALRDRVIDGFLDALHVIDANTALNPGEKAVAREAVLSAPTVFTPGMVGALCDGLRDTQIFVATATHPAVGRSDIAGAMETFQEAMNGVFMGEDGPREGIDGMDEVEVVKDALLRCAFERQGLRGEEGVQALERMTARGSAMNMYRFELERQDMSQPGVVKNNVACLQLLTGLARHLDLPPRAEQAMREVGLHSVTFGQAREILGPGVHSDKGLPEVLGFDTDGAARLLEQAVADDMRSPAPDPGQGLMGSAPEGFRAKMEQFSEGFLKDFFRNGIVVDGERIPGPGTKDHQAMEQALDRLIGHFPDAGEAGRATRGLFQAMAASVFNALLADPATAEGTMQTLTGRGDKLSDMLEFSIASRGGGRYDVQVEVAVQRSREGADGSRNDPRGLGARMDLTLTGCDRPDAPPAVRVANFDFLLATMRH